jgi:multidrug efflux pump subunit AcrA (membrane-fusion protein)
MSHLTRGVQSTAKAKRIEELEKMLRSLQASEGAGKGSESQTLRELENRLDKAVIKAQEAQFVGKTYRQIIDKLQQDRLTFDGRVTALEQAIAARKADIARLEVRACSPVFFYLVCMGHGLQKRICLEALTPGGRPCWRTRRRRATQPAASLRAWRAKRRPHARRGSRKSAAYKRSRTSGGGSTRRWKRDCALHRSARARKSLVSASLCVCVCVCVLYRYVCVYVWSNGPPPPAGEGRGKGCGVGGGTPPPR